MTTNVQDMISQLPVEYISPHDLVPFPGNAKLHDDEQIEKIAESIRRYSFSNAKAIEIDKDNVIINGHGRTLAAMKLGLSEVPVARITNLSDDEIRAYRLSDNEVAKSGYDTAKLVEEMEYLQNETDQDLLGIFSERDLQFALDDLGEIDLEAMTADISADVERHASSTAEHIAEEDYKEFTIGKVLGFGKCNASQQRAISLLMRHAEQVTDETGAEALKMFVIDFVGLQGDIDDPVSTE